MRLRAPAFQRRSRQRGDPAGVQGKAAVPVHAPLVPEDRLLSAQRGDARPRGLPAAKGFVTATRCGGRKPITLPASLPAKAGNPVTTAVAELAARFERTVTEYWMPAFAGMTLQ